MARVPDERARYWYTVREAADRLGLSRRRVAELAEERGWTTSRAGEGRTSPMLIADHCVEAERERAICACRGKA